MSVAGRILEKYYGYDLDERILVKAIGASGYRDKDELEAEEQQEQDKSVLSRLKRDSKNPNVTWARSDYPGKRLVKRAVKNKMSTGDLSTEQATKILSRFATNHAKGKRPGNGYKALVQHGKSIYDQAMAAKSGRGSPVDRGSVALQETSPEWLGYHFEKARKNRDTRGESVHSSKKTHDQVNRIVDMWGTRLGFNPDRPPKTPVTKEEQTKLQRQ